MIDTPRIFTEVYNWFSTLVVVNYGTARAEKHLSGILMKRNCYKHNENHRVRSLHLKHGEDSVLLRAQLDWCTSLHNRRMYTSELAAAYN